MNFPCGYRIFRVDFFEVIEGNLFNSFEVLDLAVLDLDFFDYFELLSCLDMFMEEASIIVSILELETPGF